MHRVPDCRTGRSVNDYTTTEDLKDALLFMGQKPSVPDEGCGLGTVAPEPDVSIDDTDVIDAVGNPVDEDLNTNLDWIVEGYDPETSNQPNLATELRRLAVLKSYRLIGQGREVAYERLCSLTSRIFKVPMTLVSVIDLGRQYYLSTRGLGDVHEGPRKTSFCAHNIISKLDLLVIPDTRKDWRFKDNAQVTGMPHIRFYAGAPLVCSEGYRLGTLCIMDTIPRPEGLSLAQKQNLMEIAAMIMDVMVEQRQAKNHEFRDPAQLIACTAHDLMTPLMGIKVGLSLIKNDGELGLSHHQQDILDTAAACASIMNRICRKTIETFQSESEGDAQSNLDSHESGATVLKPAELLKNLQMVMEPFPKQAPLIFTMDPNVPPAIVTDDLKIFRSAINFLTNACAKTESGSVHLRIYVKQEENDKMKHHLVVECEDSGPGVDVDQYQFLFKPVATEKNPLDNTGSSKVIEKSKSGASKSVIQNTGLGLYSVASQIGSIGGKYGFRPRGFTESGSPRLDANDNNLRGSIFWFSVPLVVAEDSFSSIPKPNVKKRQRSSDEVWNTKDEAALHRQEDKTVSPSHHGGQNQGVMTTSTGSRKKRALIIEDSLMCRKIMARVLSKLGFEVSQAVNGMEGVKELQTTLFDLVLCDFLMPVMDGLDCIQQYRQFEVASRPWFDQFIIGMSAHANEKDVEKGMKVGMNDFKQKPVTLSTLKEIMESNEFKYVSERLDAIAAEVEGETVMRSSKRRKIDDERGSQPSELRVCLVAEEETGIAKFVSEAAERKGWKAIIVNDGEAALRLLQMRNWDAVLLDDELPGLTSSRCVACFREWEKKNRVNRQKNVIQMSSSFIPSHLETSSSVQLPTGFDGALGKPLSMKVVLDFLEAAAESASCGSHDIVIR
jgi:CheY-like chemotaxis protein